MLRFVEVALFLAPFITFAVWRFTAVRGGPPLSLIIGAIFVVMVLVGALAWLSQEEALPPDTIYEPAHLQDGRVVSGHPVPR